MPKMLGAKMAIGTPVYPDEISFNSRVRLAALLEKAKEEKEASK